MDRDGNTTGFSGLVTHLHYHEPSNIVLVEFLVKGLFHKLCQRSKKGKFRRRRWNQFLLSSYIF